MKENLKGLPLAALEERMVKLGHPAFRGRQLYRWIYQERETDFAKMTDLSKGFREDLAANFCLPTLPIALEEKSEDGTTKFLIQLPDGQKVESVFIPTAGRNTLCVSTQVGCKMGCTFCTTAYQGFTRNVQAWEIVEQLMSIPVSRQVTNIVLMGMGEPLDNYDEVIKALQIFQEPHGIKIGKKHITVSTVGLTPKMGDFVKTNLGNLAVSLHGTTDEQRSKIMPINLKFPLEKLMQTCRELDFKGRKRVTFQYVLIEGINDSDDDARRLAKLVQDLPCKINLLAYNENPYIGFKRPPEARVLAFQNILINKNLTATYRKSRGRDIAAACGQLKSQEAKALKLREAALNAL